MDKDWLYNIPIAHRGYHDMSNGVCENSVTAFNMAIERGYTIETDLHIIKDGTLVIFHDPNLKRVCSMKRKVKELTKEELSSIKLGGTEDVIITLEEFLALVDGKVGLLIEIKAPYIYSSDAYCEKVAKVLDNYKGRFAIQSFSPFAMRWFAKNRPQWARGVLLFSKHYFFKKAINADFLAPSMRLCTPSFFKKAKAHNRKIIYYTVRTEEQHRLAREYGDNIIFEKLKLTVKTTTNAEEV